MHFFKHMHQKILFSLIHYRLLLFSSIENGQRRVSSKVAFFFKPHFTFSSTLSRGPKFSRFNLIPYQVLPLSSTKRIIFRNK